MAKVRRIDFSPDEFLVGVADLKHDEIGPYWVACSLMYSRGGPIADDDAWIARACGCHVRTWRAIKARLIAVGKLTLEDGLLSNDRCLREIESAQGRLKQSREAADRSVKARREAAENKTVSNDYKEIPEAPAQNPNELSTNYQPSTTNYHPTTTVPDEASSSAAAREPPPVHNPDIDAAFALWAPIAYELRIPDPGFLNPDRRKLLAERLAECGGLDGWRYALEKLRTAAWLRDDEDPSKPKHWVNLANLLKPENFTGLMEGRYAERHRTGNHDERSTGAAIAGLREELAR